jgi:hypothetical protein
MDIAKLLQALEEMIFEVACLAVLLPKTFFFLALFPARVHRYVSEELAKKNEDRFDGFAPPLILWVACGILPNFIFMSVVTGFPAIRALITAGGDDLIPKLLALPAETRFAAVSVFVISLPLAFAVVIAREGKKEATKSALREPLYTLSYCTAPILFAAAPLWFLWVAQSEGAHPWVTEFIPFYGGGLVLWMAWVGASLFRLHLGVTRRRAALLLGKAYLVFLGVILLLEVVILMLVGTMAGKPPA